ncbi:glycosyltransferase [Ornithinimicrobium avium]|uniref:Glycosyltransferase n=1 Tax=Ornithinimicrobium avium TaxID=2283195 RepID=A0A345NMZ4_9MICO|nr:glycosyltransferase [Ornithinimicrobium avium]AXH96402.1 glycosyltransferase [Ornithinimicrobium avium]
MSAGHGGGVVYLAGTEWHRVAGTDRQLATALASVLGPVLYVDPAQPVTHLLRRRRRRGPGQPWGLVDVAPGVTRLRTLGPPLLTRRVMVGLATWWQHRLTVRASRALDLGPCLVVVASPLAGFPRALPGVRFFYLTDDWEGGAGLMGLDPGLVRRRLAGNAAAADLVGGVTPVLVDRLAQLGPGARALLLANGCVLPPATPAARPTDLPDGRLVGLVGQLNERTDVRLLHRIAAAGLPLVLIGPLTTRDPATLRDFHDLFARPGVTWLGHRPPERLGAYLQHLTVGVTPYRRDRFNEASFPLKTLEYLAHGLPVVASDLPATRWLGTDLVDIATSDDEFVALVAGHCAGAQVDADAAGRRRSFAERHSWEARAQLLVDAVPEVGTAALGA